MALAYTDLHKHMILDLPECEPGIITNALKRAGRRFCRKTEALHEPLAPILAVDYQGQYNLAHRGWAFDTILTPHRIRTVHVNATGPGSEQEPGHYDLLKDAKLSFRSQYIPQALEDMMLLCATTTKTAYTNWTGVTDGALVIDAGGTDYTASGMDFSGAGSMDEVAHIIQTAIRAAMESQSIVVVWHINNFTIYSESGTIGYLSAPASGTDISDTYCKGTETDGTLGGFILCDVTFLPDEAHTSLPEWFMDRYWEIIMAGAMVDLLTMKKALWADPELAASKYYPIWKEAVEDATGENFTEYKTADVMASVSDWAV
jgi:hypothetical protein